MQNAAAAEQHVKDMAEYDAKVAEAAAAWEAERKKKKGKAKDEVGLGNIALCSLHARTGKLHFRRSYLDALDNCLEI